MARRTPAASSVTASVNELLEAVTDLIGKVGHAVQRLPEVGVAVRRVKVVASATGMKIGAKVKAAWARYTPKERAARVRKMLAARGLKPKAKKPPTAKGLKLRKSITASWARMTLQQRAERIAKMQAGRGLRPRARYEPA